MTFKETEKHENIFRDFPRAFGTVNHEISLKLDHYGVRSMALI